MLLNVWANNNSYMLIKRERGVGGDGPGPPPGLAAGDDLIALSIASTFDVAGTQAHASLLVSIPHFYMN